MENVILPLSSSKPFISYQLYGMKLFFFRPAKINCFRLLAFLFSAHPVLSNCSDSFQPNFRLQVHVLPCFPSATSCAKKTSRLPITGIFKENQYFDNSSLYAFFLTCHALKTWFELSKVKLIEMMWRETKAAILSSYRGFALPRVNLQ